MSVRFNLLLEINVVSAYEVSSPLFPPLHPTRKGPGNEVVRPAGVGVQFDKFKVAWNGFRRSWESV